MVWQGVDDMAKFYIANMKEAIIDGKDYDRIVLLYTKYSTYNAAILA